MPALRVFAEKLWIGVVTFVLLAVALAFAVAWVNGGLNATISAVTLALALVLAGLTVWQVRLGEPERVLDQAEAGRDWFWRWLVWGSLVLFALRAFLWLVFEKDGQIEVLSQNNLGDLPLHIQYIRFLAGGAPLWPVNPIHAHSGIGYPIGVDFFNALLECCGVDLWRGLIGTGLAGALLTGYALHRWGRTFGLAAFLFNGGIIGVLFFSTGKWVDYQQTVDWKSIPLALLVTQRGFLYALPAGLLLLTQWRARYARKDGLAGGLPFWLEASIYATMPLFHIHTFLFLSVVLGMLAVFGGQRRRAWLVLGTAVLPASWQVWLLTDGFRAGSGLAWQPGWLQGPKFDALYWLQNFGVMPVFFVLLVLAALVRWREASSRTALLLVLPATLVFAATLLVRFSPWAWDNTKLMMWAYLVMMPFLWSEILQPAPWILRVPTCAMLFFSGFISLWGGLGPQFTGCELVEKSDVEDVGQAVRNVPITAVFACARDYAHPLVFNGRRLALGYAGHMLGHGLSDRQESRDLTELMLGLPGWEMAARRLGVSYVYWGAAEKDAWPDSSQPWACQEKLLASGTWGEIYRLDW